MRLFLAFAVLVVLGWSSGGSAASCSFKGLGTFRVGGTAALLMTSLPMALLWLARAAYPYPSLEPQGGRPSAGPKRKE